MGKRVRLTDDSLNNHGSRVLTAGVETEQYKRNPVLLYMHERGKVIGYMKDIEVKDGEITGEPVFDCATELSKQCKKQWEVGSLRMVSIGIDVLELSEEPEHLVAGQTAPTITKSKIFETSIVDIGANDNAIVMRRDGKQITLGKDSENPLPMLSNKPQKTEPKMELKTLAFQLGLPETADEATVNAEIAKLKASKDDTDKIRKENEELKLAQITTAVDAAVAEKKIPTEKKEHFINIGKKLGIDELKETLAAMSPQVKISSTIEPEPEHKETLAKSPWEERMAEIRKNRKK